MSPGGSSGSGRPGARAARWAGGGAGAALGGQVGKARGGVAALVAARAEREMGEGWLGEPGWGGGQGRGPGLAQEEGGFCPPGWRGASEVWAFGRCTGDEKWERLTQGAERGARSPRLGEPRLGAWILA